VRNLARKGVASKGSITDAILDSF